MSTNILVVDDHGVLREGLAALLNAEPEMKVVGEATSGGEAIHLAAKLEPNIILMDISLPDINGIEATRQAKKIVPETSILILTVHDDTGLLREAVQAGASGYILKRAVKSQLVQAIHTVMRGDLYIDPTLTRSLILEDPIEEKPTITDETLTPREIEVLRLLAQGYTNRQAADLLNISVRTVEFHRSNIMGKLGLRSRVELVRYAESKELIGT